MIFSPKVGNDLRFNYSSDNGSENTKLDAYGGAVPPSESLLFPAFASSQNAFTFLFLGSNALVVGQNVKNKQRQINLIDTLSYTVGSHAMKFGVDYRRLLPIFDSRDYGRFLFFNSVGDIINGTLNFGTIFGDDTIFYPVFNNFSAFAQDTWKVTQRLSLTYGLRYEINPSPTEKNGNLPFTINGLEDIATMSLAPKGAQLYKTTYNNFAPRVGIAYRLLPEHGTVLRGGFGIFYDLGYNQAGMGIATETYPYGRRTTLVNVPFPSDAVSAPAPPFSVTPPHGPLHVFEPDHKLPYTIQYNVAVEQAIGINNTFSATYVGAAGRRLMRLEQLSDPNPSFSLVRIARGAASSDYHALQLQFQRRLSQGLQVLASYTWSHSIDNVSDESLANIQASTTKIDPDTDRGPSSFDLRHSFSAALSYNLPAPLRGRIGRMVTGGWSVDSMARARSAAPINIITNRSFLDVNTVARPDLIPGVPIFIADPTVPSGRRLNREAFSIPAGRQGTLGRNALRGFPASQIDIALRRQFNLGERMNLQFRIDVFNIFNHPNFADPDGALFGSFGDTNENFGVSTQMLGRILGGLRPLYQIGGPRSMQLALKFQF
jgi:hypothetical protein